MTTSRSPFPLSRRRALAGATGVGVALPVLAACGGDDQSTTAATDPTSASSPSSPVAPSEADGPSTAATTEPAAAAGVVATADVPVGSGVILADEQVVVTQPTEGEIKVFSSICTHTGCPVSGISDTISCPCHGSSFDLATGEVLGGPATAPLAAVDFSVDGDQVVLG